MTAGCTIGCAVTGCAITGCAAGTWTWKPIPSCSPGGIRTCTTPLGVCTCIGMPPCMPCGTCTDIVCTAGCACITGLSAGCCAVGISVSGRPSPVVSSRIESSCPSWLVSMGIATGPDAGCCASGC
eukprot:scaffold34402_cov51-Phaeocystis_antarctica.AAC.2